MGLPSYQKQYRILYCKTKAEMGAEENLILVFKPRTYITQ